MLDHSLAEPDEDANELAEGALLTPETPSQPEPADTGVLPDAPASEPLPMQDAPVTDEVPLEVVAASDDSPETESSESESGVAADDAPSRDAAGSGSGELEELTLPSSVATLEPLASGTVVGP